MNYLLQFTYLFYFILFHNCLNAIVFFRGSNNRGSMDSVHILMDPIHPWTWVTSVVINIPVYTAFLYPCFHYESFATGTLEG